MTSDDDWRRQRAEEIFGSDPMPWTIAPPRAKPAAPADSVQPITWARQSIPMTETVKTRESAAPQTQMTEPAARSTAVPADPTASASRSAIPSQPPSTLMSSRTPSPATAPQPAAAPQPSSASVAELSSRQHGAARLSVEDELRWIKVDPLMEPPAESRGAAFAEPRSRAPWRLIAVVAALLLALGAGWFARTYVDPRATPLSLPSASTAAMSSGPAAPEIAANVPPEQTQDTPVAVEPPPVDPLAEPAVALAPSPAVVSVDPLAQPLADRAVAPVNAERRTGIAAVQTDPFPVNARPTDNRARTEGTVAVRSVPVPMARPVPPQTAIRQAPVQTGPREAPVQLAMRSADEAVPVPPPVRTARGLANRPSFDCRRSSSAITHAICGDPELAALDRQLASRFIALDSNADRGTVEAVHGGQTTFLNDRQSCTDRDCLVEVYRNRLRQLDEIEN